MNRIVILLTLLVSGCNWPYGEFGEGDRKVYVCGQDGDGIVTAQPCSERSSNHLHLLDSGLTGGMALFIDLCDAYTVTAVGDLEVVGEPPFEHRVLGWSQYVDQKDSSNAAYGEQECRHVYTQ